MISLIERWTDKVHISVTPGEDDWWHASVAQYDLLSLSALKEKLAQFPNGTTFLWPPGHLGPPEEEERLFLEMKTFIEERGMQLEKQSPEPVGQNYKPAILSATVPRMVHDCNGF
jgi:hypothetical protein